ncbi:MAG TPA: rod shape-determining protein [Pyrinomonadaceae bacterium]|jgi:rod shape-determining protein MreB
MNAKHVISKLRGLIADPDLAIDLGTANTRLYAMGDGLVVDSPTVLFESSSDRGGDAQSSFKTSNEGAYAARGVMPLSGGVVTDAEAAAALLGKFLQRARRFGIVNPRALVCAPSDASQKERAALTGSVLRAGASAVKVIPEPLAAAVGAGLDISLPYAQMLVDIGDGVTDIAVIRSGVLVRTAAVRLGCSDLYPAVRRLVASRFRVMLFSREAERLTREIGSVHRSSEPGATSSALGLNRINGRVTSVCISSEDVSSAIRPVIDVIRETVSCAFRRLPPDIAAEVIEGGILLTGGGACLPGMRELIAEETSVEVKVAADPLHAVINGASQMLAIGEITELWNKDERRWSPTPCNSP